MSNKPTRRLSIALDPSLGGENDPGLARPAALYPAGRICTHVGRSPDFGENTNT
jgi:hypothetical protein